MVKAILVILKIKSKKIKMGYLNKFFLNLIVLLFINFFFNFGILLAVDEPKDMVFKAKVNVKKIPQPIINIEWDFDSLALDYKIYRKLKNDTSWIELVKLDKSVTTFTDSNINIGIGYEYSMKKERLDFDAFGYYYAGIELPEIEYRGKVLLIIDNTIYLNIKDELKEFKKDLIGDGWQVIERVCRRSENFDKNAVQEVKSIVDEEYRKDSLNLKALILIGRVPVPYSGEYAVDGHFPNHYGAWPSDIYYGVMSKGWSDSIANTTSAERSENWNIPDDGKFDQTVIPSDTRLQIGRIDFYNLPVFKESELELIKLYFQKNHRYRTKQISFESKAIIQDGFGLYSGESFASNAWMNFYAILGADNIEEGNYIETLQNKSYIFGYGCNQGAYDNIYKTAYADQFATMNINSIFAIFLGSYLADWDSKNNLLRSAIASQPSILVSFFSGRPFWHFHHISLGETIGFSELISANNRQPGTDRCLYNSNGQWGYREIHNTILGDPTIRLHIVEPIKDIRAELERINGEKRVKLQWEHPSDSEIIGYYIYKARTYDNSFIRINDKILKENQYIDYNILPDSSIYMIRALKLQQTVTGSYYNLSQGLFAEVFDSTSKFKDRLNAYPNPVDNHLKLDIFLENENNVELAIFNLNAQRIRLIENSYLKKGSHYYNWDTLDENGNSIPSGIYYARLKIGTDVIFKNITIIH